MSKLGLVILSFLVIFDSIRKLFFWKKRDSFFGYLMTWPYYSKDWINDPRREKWDKRTAIIGILSAIVTLVLTFS